MSTYPDAPWHLEGTLMLSLFAVPAHELPAVTWPRPLTIGGRAIVGVAFARYEPPGVLAYDELLAATATVALVPTVLQIWVDSPQSRAGGRALWGIPKELATFGGGAGIARLRARARSRGPRLPLPIATLQHLAGRDHLALNLVTARARPVQAEWEFAPGGPLAWLHERRPLLSVALTDAKIAFGLVSRSWAPPTGRRRRRPPAARSAPAPRR